MRFLSLCSGIEAASVAWGSLGWKAAALAEIEPFPSAVLAHHYPDIPNLGDVTKFKEWPEIGPVDLICGGTPCQAFSVAGLRKGLTDPRGNLSLTFLAIVDKYRPRWVVWENVPGVLSSNGGRDFGAFLAGLGQLGYGWSYRVLDAQYCRVDGYPEAVPQRRRRVFVVGYLGDWRNPAAVLSEPQSMLGDTAPGRKTKEKIAPTLSARTKGGGGLGADFDLDGGLIKSDTVSKCLTKGCAQRLDLETESFVSHTLLATPNSSHAPDLETYVASSLTAGMSASASRMPQEQGTLVPIAFDCKGTEVQYIEGGSHPTLRSMGHSSSHASAGGHAAVCVDMGVRRLTPVECERLQGFPDGYTAIAYRGKPVRLCPDGPRYKALGNSWAVNVARWVGRRIQLVEDVQAEITGSKAA